MLRLFPEPAGVVSVDEAYAASLGSSTTRPWVGLCMITSLDGSTVLDGRSGGLGGATDRTVLRRLRAIADVIVVGAATARTEGYGPPSKRGQRIGVVTARGSIDPGSPLFTSGAGFVITCDSTDLPPGLDVIRAGGASVDLAAAFGALEEIVPGCRVVQVEGGPTLNAALFDADLVDELNLSLAPMVVGGGGHRLVDGDVIDARSFDLSQVTSDDEGYLFTRWRRRR